MTANRVGAPAGTTAELRPVVKHRKCPSIAMLVNLSSPTEYEAKEAGAVRRLQELLDRGEEVAIKKNVKHSWKNRSDSPNLDLRDFNKVISIDTERCTAEVEGFTTFYDLVAAASQFDLMPQAVPELRSITVGGAIAGLGGQSSSFRFGLIHEMVTEFDLLTGEGKVVHCSPEENSDLFYMLANSYGSLGYVLRCKIRLNRTKQFVRLDYLRFGERGDFFAEMEREIAAQTVDFVEGVAFSGDQFILLTGSFVDSLPADAELLFPLHDPFFLSVRNPEIKKSYLTVHDYIWRWDPDTFWATDQKNIFGKILLNPLFRKTAGGLVLRSDRLIKIGKFRNKLRRSGSAGFIFQEPQRREALIQDAAIPIDAAPEFDRWLADELQIFPLWYCPVRTTRPIGAFPLYRPGSEVVIDFGFYCSMDLDSGMDEYYYNRRIEEKLVDLDGIKCLYSDTFFPEDLFWRLYDKEAYDAVKLKYDPTCTFKGLYEKVVNQV